MKAVVLFQDGDHQWISYGQDPNRPDHVIDTNQLVFRCNHEVLLIDPGGVEIFPEYISALTRDVALEDINHILVSHQDPDTGSSLGLWKNVCPARMQVYVSWLWSSFMAHFDGNTTFTTVPDEGMPLTVGGYKLEVLPAHYLHSPGNLCVYDAKAKVLFSGDIGASLVDTQHLQSIYVQDFESHIQHMAGFHRRWMGSNEAKVAWVHMVRQLQVDLLVPQHGLIFRGDNVRKFLDWFEALPVSGGLAAYEQALHRLKLRPMMP